MPYGLSISAITQRFNASLFLRLLRYLNNGTRQSQQDLATALWFWLTDLVAKRPAPIATTVFEHNGASTSGFRFEKTTGATL
jgi:hypothetical protein